MVISSKPKKREVDVDALINKGGTVAAKESGSDPATLIRLQLRLPPDMLARIDSLINKRLAKPSRHHWLLEAIEEKLKREEQA
jgi:hypothetical protein